MYISNYIYPKNFSPTFMVRIFDLHKIKTAEYLSNVPILEMFYLLKVIEQLSPACICYF